MPPVRLRVPSAKISSASPSRSRSCAMRIVRCATCATARDVITASSDARALFCGVLIVPKQRLEKRRLTFE